MNLLRRIEVIKVQKNYSICRSYETEEINGLAGLVDLGTLANYGTRTVKKEVPLNVDEADFEDTVTSLNDKIKKSKNNFLIIIPPLLKFLNYCGVKNSAKTQAYFLL